MRADNEKTTTGSLAKGAICKCDNCLSQAVNIAQAVAARHGKDMTVVDTKRNGFCVYDSMMMSEMASEIVEVIHRATA